MTHSNDIVNSNSEINWTGVIKKEARGINDADFGKVHEVVSHFILTEKGLITKEKYYFPTGLVKGFDGDKLRFDISEEEADAKFKRETTPSREEYAKYDKKGISRKNTMVIEEEKAERKAQAIVQQSEDKARKDADKRYEEITREAEDKARQQAEVNAQAMVQQIQDKARMEAERKAQAIVQQSEDKARKDADKRYEEITREAEDKARQQAEVNAQAIVQQIQDKARMEAERKAQAIVQQSEDKARKDADKRYEEITREAEDKARQQAEVNAQAIVKQSEESSDQLGFEDKRASTQGIVISMKDSENYTKADGNYEGNKIYNPYVTSMNLLNNYSKIWATWYNEVLKNITGVRDFWTYNNDWSYNNLPSKKINIAG